MRDKDQEVKNTIISLKERPAGIKYAEIFQIAESEPIYYIKRLNSINDIPIAIEEIYLPKNVIPNLESINLSDFSLYELYDYYDIHVTHASQTLEVTQLNKNEVRLLEINEKQSVYYFKSLTFAGKLPIEYAKVFVRSDLCSYTVKFCKKNL